MRHRVAFNRAVALSIAISAALLALTIGSVFATTTGATETRSLTSSADTHILENAPKKNYGTVTSLGVGGDEPAGTGKDQSALLKWSLSTIPAGSKISSASVTLNVTNTSTQIYQAYELKRPWVESAATWLLYATGKSWQTAGAKGSLDRGVTVVGSVSPSTTGNQTFALSPALVQSWVDNPASNQGIIIANVTNTDGFAFSSRETSTSSLRPQLTLNLSLDTTPPETTLDSGPSGTVSSSSTSFAFSSSEPNSTFECSLDGGAFTSCSSPKSYTGLSEGSHTFQVRAKDTANNVDPTPASRTWTVDTVAPSVSIDSGPSGAVSNTSASFTFSTNDQSATFQCSLDGAAFASCSSPKSYTGLSEGSHTFQVRATDAAGNTDSIPASTTWTVDTTAPDTTIDTGTSGTISVAEATFEFSSEAGASFECRLDGTAYSACTSPKSYTNLTNGSHTFDVRATDAVGNVDTSPASETFSVDAPPPPDTTPPETTIDSGPSGTVSSSSTDFAFSSSEAGTTFECSLDSAAYTACISPESYSGLSEGSHTLQVKATDQAGNTDASPASRIWTVDTTSPETIIDSGPSGTVSTSSASFAFSANETGSTFECSLVAGGAADSFSSCASPKDYTNLSNGSYSFKVRAKDAAGNTDASPASRNFSVQLPLNRINVTSAPYNATPNDSTNDTTAFEAAMADADPNDEVYVPSGMFRLANVNIPSDTNLAIEAATTIKKYGTNNGPVFTMQGVANTSFVQNIHVYGVNGSFTMDLSDAPQDTTGLRLRSVKNFSIKNMDEIGRADPSSANSVLKPVISFLPMDTTPLNGEYEHPHNGVIENVSAVNQAFGWGATQLTGAEDVHFQDISSEGGVALRLENFEAKATTIDDVTADNIICVNGHNAVNMNPHNADNGDVHITDVTANSCWQGINLADDPAFPNANFDSPSTIDRTTVIAGNNAQHPASGDGWTVGPSEWCVDSDVGLVYSVQITNLDCGGLPSGNWP
jgi:Bacterial Ig-like domain